MFEATSKIDTTTMAFSYDCKTTALRCNDVIGSIFSEQIQPVLEKVITATIPEEMRLQLDTFEIDIGTINEKELPEELAKRIQVAFEKALYNELHTKEKGFLMGSTSSSSTPTNYLLAALAFYLTKGYFPIWIKRGLSFEQLVTKLIDKAPEESIALFKKHSHTSAVMMRLSAGLSPKAFDALVYKVNRVNYQFIIDVKEKISAFQNKEVLLRFGQKGFLQLINSFVLSALFKISTNALHKVDFIESILASYMSRFSVESTTLLNTISTSSDTSIVTKLMKEALLGKEGVESISISSNSSLDITNLIAYCNETKQPIDFENSPWSNLQIVALLKNDNNRSLVLNTLNTKGITSFLVPFLQKDTPQFIRFATSFVKAFKQRTKAFQLFQSVQGMAVFFVLYTNAASNKTLRYDDFFLTLISMFRSKEDSFLEAPLVLKFITSQPELALKKIRKRLVDTTSTAKRSKIKKSLLKYVKAPLHKKGGQANSSTKVAQTVDFYAVNVATHYLEFGYLPPAYEDVTKMDIQNLFETLLQSKHPFLVKLIANTQSPIFIYERISAILTDEVWLTLKTYLVYHFYKAITSLESLIDTFKNEFKKQHINVEIPTSLERKIVITSLLQSKGKKQPSLFFYVVSQGILQTLSVYTEVSKTLLLSIGSQYNTLENSNEIQKETNAKTFDTATIQQHIQEVIVDYINYLKKYNYGAVATNTFENHHLKTLYHVLTLYPKEFQAVLAQNQIDLTQMTLFFKAHLPDTIWKRYKEVVSSTIVIKDQLFPFQNKTESLFLADDINEKEMVIIFNEFEGTNIIKIRTLCVFLLKNERSFNKFFEAYKKGVIPLTSQVWIAPFKEEVIALLHIQPQTLSKGFPTDYWSTLVVRFVLQLALEAKNAIASQFSKTFVSFLHRELRAKNKETVYYKLLHEFASSSSNPLKYLVTQQDDTTLNFENTLLSSGTDNELLSINEIDFDTLKDLNQKYQKQVYILLYKDVQKRQDVISYLKTNPIPLLLLGTDKKSQEIIQVLFTLKPKALKTYLDNKAWKALILQVVLYLKVTHNEYTLATFNKVFVAHYKERVASIDKMELLLECVRDETFSHKTVLENWVQSLPNIEHTKNPIGNKQFSSNDEGFETGVDLKSSVTHHISILAFYAHQGFLPWWSQETAIETLVDVIFKESQQLGAAFESVFLEMEHEKQFISLLVPKLPASLMLAFSLICSNHPRLKSIWAQRVSSIKMDENEGFLDRTAKKNINNDIVPEVFIKNEAFMNANQLKKAIYYLTDEEILNQKLYKDPAIVTQIKVYVALAPFAYFQTLTPSKWRMLVYDFAFHYYKATSGKVQQEFHSAFVKHLQTKHTAFPWEVIFKAMYGKIKTLKKPTSKIAFPKELLRFITPVNTNNEDINTQTTHLKDNNMDESNTRILIQNSGLILLWPFFTRYFEQLQLVANGAFISQEAKNRAVYLLQYLVIGDINFPEHELVLNKQLVGIPMEDPLLPIDALTQDEIALAESLLNGFRSNWEKVASSTIMAIQETFLYREGLLDLQNDKSILTIEKRGVDILVSTIPWNFSLIKLPWMQQPLYIDWL